MSVYVKIWMVMLWGFFLLYWLFSAMNTKKAASLDPFYKRFFYYWFPLIIAIFLLGPNNWFGDSFIREDILPHTNLVGLIGLFASAIGVAFACWARYTLGKNWSLSVQKKENHELISTGAYQFVRHPIYTGILLLFIGTAVIVGEYRGLISIVIVFISFWLKLKKEERWMSEVFAEKYVAYKQKTKALIPWLL